MLLSSGLRRILRRVYPEYALAAFEARLAAPPSRYYVRVNLARARAVDVLRLLRSEGFEVYLDEYFPEAVWAPVEFRGSEPPCTSSCPCWVTVDKATAESVYMGANVYAPGVARIEGECSDGATVCVADPRGVIVACGKLAASWRTALREGRGLVVEVSWSPFRVPSFRGSRAYELGLLYEQGLPSMSVVRALDPKPGSLIVDMCAAPGGKATHAAEYITCKGKVLAFDHSRRRLRRLLSEARRLGLSCIEARVADSRYLDVDYPELRGRVDYVILDPPCTSIGRLPTLYVERSERDVANAAAYQKQFVRVAARLLKPGGLMAYSTCTATAEEDEDIVRYAIEELGFELLDVLPRIPVASQGLLSGTARFHPHVHNQQAYFVAVLRRSGGRA